MTIFSLWQRLGVVPVSPGLREMTLHLSLFMREADFRLDLLCVKTAGVPKKARSSKGSMACSWNISKSEGKSKDHPTPRQGTSCILPSPPLGATRLTWLRGLPLSGWCLGLFPLPLYAPGASWAPIQKEGATGHQRDRKELVGGLFLGEFSEPSGEAPGNTVFANLALQPTSTGLVTVTGIYFHCHLWALSYWAPGQNLTLEVGDVC